MKLLAATYFFPLENSYARKQPIKIDISHIRLTLSYVYLAGEATLKCLGYLETNIWSVSYCFNSSIS